MRNLASFSCMSTSLGVRWFSAAVSMMFTGFRMRVVESASIGMQGSASHKACEYHAIVTVTSIIVYVYIVIACDSVVCHMIVMSTNQIVTCSFCCVCTRGGWTCVIKCH